MKRRILTAAAALVAVALLGAAGALLGLAPVAASEGHWPITAWFLDRTLRSSISLRALGVAVPELDDPALVLRGAGHFETGCRPCHGSPALPEPLIPSSMTPQPPYLPEQVPTWSSAELFYIVKHGVKLTGMPAWPAQQRDDEVWALVAFLRELPELDAAGYRDLVGGEQVDALEGTSIGDLGEPRRRPRLVATSCARCHGADGLGRGAGAFPKLAGQRREYLLGSLRAFAAGERHSGIMRPVVAGLPDEALEELAAHYASLPPPEPEPAADAALVARGEALAQRGRPERRIPSCMDCHGPGGSPRPQYPRLAGQHPAYLALQLELFAEGHRGGTPFARLMREFAHALEPDDRRAAAAYYASLPPDPRTR